MTHEPRFNIFSEEEEKVYFAIRNVREKLAQPIVAALARHHVLPDVLSYTGLLMLVPFVYFFYINPWIAFVFFALNILCDTLDGSLARYLKKDSDRGAVLDVACDYLSFFVIVLTFLYFRLADPFWGAIYLLNYVLLQGFILYVRAKKLSIFPVFKTKLGCYLVFVVWLLTGQNYFDPFLILASVYMIITNLFLFQRIRWSL